MIKQAIEAIELNDPQGALAILREMVALERVPVQWDFKYLEGYVGEKLASEIADHINDGWIIENIGTVVVTEETESIHHDTKYQYIKQTILLKRAGQRIRNADQSLDTSDSRRAIHNFFAEVEKGRANAQSTPETDDDESDDPDEQITDEMLCMFCEEPLNDEGECDVHGADVMDWGYEDDPDDRPFTLTDEVRARLAELHEPVTVSENLIDGNDVLSERVRIGLGLQDVPQDTFNLAIDILKAQGKSDD